MSKRGLKINVKINLTNRWLYTLIAIGILAIISVGVYAVNTSQAWHFVDQVEGLGSLATKDNIDWNTEITNMPSGFADGVDDAGDACGSGMDAVFSYLNSGEDSFGSDSTGHLLNSIKPDTCNGDTDNKYYNCPASASKYCKDIFLYSGFTNYGYRYVTCKKRANVQCLEP